MIATKPVVQALSTSVIGWLLAGGLAYTLGVVFFAARRIRYAHFVWHLFVIMGTACHVVAVFLAFGSA